VGDKASEGRIESTEVTNNAEEEVLAPSALGALDLPW
jgi:hypothetical protein